jgi:hypothetical protein
MGYGCQVLSVMAGFILLQATYSYIALLIDNEDMKLIIYSPLFVIGYKEVRNFIKLKALIDTIRKKEMKWGAIQRIGETQTTKKREKT